MFSRTSFNLFRGDWTQSECRSGGYGGTAAGRGHMSTTYPSKVLRGDLEPAFFMIDLAKKDLDIAIKFSETLGVPISLPIQAEKIYTDAQADGRGRQDWTCNF